MVSHRSMFAAGIAAAFAVGAHGQTVELLHHSDGESQLIDAGSGLEDFGGIARFATVIANLRADAAVAGRDTILLTSGDNFLAGSEFNASLENGVPYFDAIGLDLIGYDAFILGNHDFDFGPQVLANFITSFSATQPPFLSARARGPARGRPHRLQHHRHRRWRAGGHRRGDHPEPAVHQFAR